MEEVGLGTSPVISPGQRPLWKAGRPQEPELGVGSLSRPMPGHGTPTGPLFSACASLGPVSFSVTHLRVMKPWNQAGATPSSRSQGAWVRWNQARISACRA